jgi:catechol 2,3-dioxygenase-like lactoylglutathione lyase family enzyme
MAAQLNHTIVHATDKRRSATFLSDVLGLPEPKAYGPFLGVETGNGVTLDYMDVDPPIIGQHYAFLVSEDEFDEIFARIVERSVPYWADPAASQPGKINHHDGGRGVYFVDPDDHFLEIITRPYGSGNA